jgi:hypothetical protein
MKRFILVTMIAFLGLSVSSQKVFFPLKEGIKLTYQTTDKSDKETGKVKYTVKEVSGSGTNFTVVYEIESLDKKDKLVYKDEVKVTQEGDKIYFDMSNFLNKAAFQQNGEIPATVEITGNNMEIPVIPVPGMTMPDANCTMSMKMGFINMKTTVLLTNRKVEAVEDLTVPAGSFNAFKLSADVNATVLGLKVNSTSKEWYAYGIGIVKSESYDKNGKLQSTMQLVELVK